MLEDQLQRTNADVTEERVKARKAESFAKKAQMKRRALRQH